MKKAIVTQNGLVPNRAIVINKSKCVGCNACVNVCRSDVLLPSTDKDGSPWCAYPRDCWFCGVCVQHCKVDAISMVHPINQKIGWKNKKTGRVTRL